MEKRKRSLKNKIAAIILCAVMIAGLVPSDFLVSFASNDAKNNLISVQEETVEETESTAEGLEASTEETVENIENTTEATVENTTEESITEESTESIENSSTQDQSETSQSTENTEETTEDTKSVSGPVHIEVAETGRIEKTESNNYKTTTTLIENSFSFIKENSKEESCWGYKIHIPEDGVYTLAVRASNKENKSYKLAVSINGESREIDIKSTNNWKKYETNLSDDGIELKKGDYLLKLESEKNVSCNVKWVELRTEDNDITRPQIKGISIDGKAVNNNVVEVHTNSTAKVSVKVADKASGVGIEGVYYYIRDKKNNQICKAEKDGDEYVFEIAKTGEYYIYCKDNVGNMSYYDGKEILLQINIIKEPLGVNIFNENNLENWTNKDLDIEFNIKNILSDIDENLIYICKSDENGVKNEGNEEYIAKKTQNGYGVTINAQSYDGYYVIGYKDGENELISKPFKVNMDNTAPDEPVIRYVEDESFVKRLLNKIFHFNSDNNTTKVEITAGDNLSGVGIFEINLNNKKTVVSVDDNNSIIVDEENSNEPSFISDIEKIADGISFKIKNVKDDYKDSIKVDVTDRAGNKYSDTNAGNLYNDNDNVIVVDGKEPEITVEYNLSEADMADGQMVGAIKNSETDGFLTEVDELSQAEEIHVNKNVTARIEVNEQNFFEGKNSDGKVIHELGILLTRTDNNGKIVKTEYLPKGSASRYEDSDNTEYIEWKTDGDNNYYCEINYNSDAKYELKVEYDDFGKNKSKITSPDRNVQEGVYTSKPIVVNTKEPECRIEVKGKGGLQYDNDDNVYYSEIESIELSADGRSLRDVSLKNNGREWKLEWKQDENNPSKWTARINKDSLNESIYNLELKCHDVFDNSSEDIKNIELDSTAPELNIKYDNTSKIIKILDKIFNFNKNNENIKVTIIAKDKGSGIYSIPVLFDENTVTDKELPENLKFNIVKNSEGKRVLQIEGKGGFLDEKDISSTINGESVEISFEIPAQMRGTIKADALDLAENKYSDTNDGKLYNDNNVIVVDHCSPEIKVEYGLNDNKDGQMVGVKYNKSRNDIDLYDPIKGPDSLKQADEIHANKNVTARIEVKEQNFFEGKNSDGKVIHELGILLTRTDNNGKTVKTEYLPKGSESKYKNSDNAEYIEWKYDGDNKYHCEISYNSDAEYVLEINYKDFSENSSMITSMDNDVQEEVYTSKPIVVNTKEPECKIEVKGKDGLQYDSDDMVYYKEIDSIELSVEGRSLRDVSLKNNGQEWNVKWVQDKDDVAKWTAKIDSLDENTYNFEFSCMDVFENHAEDVKNIVLDSKAPELSIKYDNVNRIVRIFNKIFNFNKNNENIKVTISAKDKGSGVYSVPVMFDENTITDNKKLPENLKFNVEKNSQGKYVLQIEGDGGFIDVENISSKVDGESAEISFEVPAQMRGMIKIDASDRAGNKYSEANDGKLYDDNNIIVVDNISPEINVEYSVEDNSDSVKYYNSNGDIVDDYDKASGIYCNRNMVAKINIKEANFFEGEKSADGNVIHQVGIVLTKTNNDGKTVKTEYLPKNSAPKYKDYDNTEYIEWKCGVDNNYYCEISYDSDADYVLSIEYTDFSENTNKYNSKKITVDKMAPVIQVEYSDSGSLANTIDGREYYNAGRTAKIKIREHNFRPSDIVSDITAVNVTGGVVPVENYAEYLKNRSSWTKDGDVYTAVIKYNADANYTFTISYEDLAGNKAQDYGRDVFTVDKTAPYNLTVSYSTSLLQRVLEGISFGYYNAPVTVTITATDDTSPVHNFIYNCIKAQGVSNINSEIVNEAISESNIRYNGNTAAITFNLPKSIANQFNGTVGFTAYDRAENSSELKDNRRIVVDNISPTATITFNTPVQTENNISYYSGDISASIVINEANFYSEDVVVTVTKNGTAYPVSVNWNNNSTDTHTGSFTLHDDGEYIVSVSYTDRSGNAMASYTSSRMIIDTKEPVITVTNIKNKSANNADVIGVKITVTDKNIAIGSFKPVLTAIVKKAVGNNKFTYETITIDLGEPKVSVNSEGETVYEYTVMNLETDGYYSLSCSAVDYAGHNVSIINSEDAAGKNEKDETVNFSVNREGSVFWIETEHDDKYDNNRVIKNELDGAFANDSVKVVLHELNVDEVDSGSSRSLFTLNDGSKSEDITLKEGENYIKNKKADDNAQDGGWFECTYTLNNDNFDHDGVYSLNIITYDKAGNSNVNVKESTGTINFTVDRTNPVITANVKSSQVINEPGYTVNFKVTETNLDSESVSVKVNGKEVSPESIGLNEYSFPLKESSKAYTLEISAKDLAGNSAEVMNVNNLIVSTNIFVRWYANKPAFWGTIGGVAGIAVIFILLLIFGKKKKEDRQ